MQPLTFFFAFPKLDQPIYQLTGLILKPPKGDVPGWLKPGPSWAKDPKSQLFSNAADLCKQTTEPGEQKISIFENNLVKTANFNIGQKVKTFVREVVLYIPCFK